MIEMNKMYKTRSGLPVRVIATDIESAFPVCAALKTNKNKETLLRYTNNGRYHDHYKSEFDLIEVTPYDDFKEDDLCVVWNTGMEKSFRYFHKVNKSGKASCFNFGKTSFTTDVITSWDFCRKATEEEIKTKTIKD